MRPKRLMNLLCGIVVVVLLGAASVGGAAADDVATSVWTTESSLDKEIRRIFNDEAGKSIDKTLQILRRKGFTCTSARARTDYDYYCYLDETYLTITDLLRVPYPIRVSILLSVVDGGKLKLEVAKFVTWL